MIRCIDELSEQELRGKRVLVRAGLDLSLTAAGDVSDLFRVKRSVPTLAFLSRMGAKTIILSHIGRDPKQTNEVVAKALRPFVSVSYVSDLFGHAARGAIDAMKPGDILLLENVRQFYDLEKSNDDGLAHDMASLGDIYVNDAFSNSHREHASMSRLPALLPHFMGFLVRDEVRELSQALNPPRPAIAFVGGAKFETKDPIIRSLLEKYDHVGVVGALANDILKVRGMPVGRSLVSEHAPDLTVANHPNLLCSLDVTVRRPDGQVRVVAPTDVQTEDMIVDIGPDTVAQFATHIREAQFVLWNGPTGLYEDGFLTYTHQVGELVSKRTAAGAHVVIGGGDTIAALEESGCDMDTLGFLSTGGGAMLEYLVHGSLPALKALE